METIQNLDPKTLEALKDLVEVNADSVRGYETAAKQIENEELSRFFLNVARQRLKNVVELRLYLGLNDEEVSVKGSMKGKLHRMWLDVRGALQAGDPHAILSEAERGEDVIKKGYEDVLIDTAGSALNDVLQRHLIEVKRHHDMVRAMRDTSA